MSSEDPSERDPREVLQSLSPGTEVELLRADGKRFRGSIVPPIQGRADHWLQLKLESGYNVGFRLSSEDRVRVISAPPTLSGGRTGTPRALPEVHAGDWVAILTTGGTIASRVDYRTGGVRPVQDEDEILTFYPHLDEHGPVRIVPIFDRLSEEIVPADWAELARRIANTFASGARGIVVAHGTDTLAFTAAALSFALSSLPGPVVLVGAQRSPDRPSSDGSSNLGAATQLARSSDLGEVVVVMHAGLSDTRFAIHRGTRVRKMHSTRRDAFETRNGPPLGTIDEDGIHLGPSVRPRTSGGVVLDDRLDENAALVWFHPGLNADRVERSLGDARGVILAGTGLGHVSSAHHGWIRRALARGAFVGMTTQCLAGLADPYVYSTGRELGRLGVTYLNDLLPETAYVKLLFALGRSRTPSEVAQYLLTDVAGEFEPRHSASEHA
jgi:glutamyl-tRNA(Gln) amidotransferase subunit D